MTTKLFRLGLCRIWMNLNIRMQKKRRLQYLYRHHTLGGLLHKMEHPEMCLPIELVCKCHQVIRKPTNVNLPGLRLSCGLRLRSEDAAHSENYEKCDGSEIWAAVHTMPFLKCASKSSILNIYRFYSASKMYRFRVSWRPFRHIAHRVEYLSASSQRSLRRQIF